MTDSPRHKPGQNALSFINGDIVAIRTGGTLLDRDIVGDLRDAGIEVQVVQPALVKRNKTGWKPTLVGLAANVIEAFRTFRMGEVVLVSHGIYRDVWIAKWIWLLRFRIRVVYFIYHFDFNLKRGLTQKVRWFIESAAIRGAHTVLTISESSRSQVVKMGVPAEKIWVMPIAQTRVPIEVIPTRDSASPCVFLFVGTVEPRKGLHIALDALARLPSSCRCELRIAGVRGNDDYCAELFRKAERLTNCAVQFLGRISDEELEREFTEADAFLFPSLWEGYGIAIEEAICLGLPVVSTSAGSIPELVRDGEEGWLVPPGDVAALAEALLDCISRPEERLARAHRALARAKALSQRGTHGVFVRDIVLNLLNTPPTCE